MSNVVHIVTRQSLDPGIGAEARPGECLPCYLDRNVGGGPCPGGFVWSEHYRRASARRATALVRRLQSAGAACDCEVLQWIWSTRRWSGSCDDDAAPVAECLGVRAGSTQPCDLWVQGKDLAL